MSNRLEHAASETSISDNKTKDRVESLLREASADGQRVEAVTAQEHAVQQRRHQNQLEAALQAKRARRPSTQSPATTPSDGATATAAAPAPAPDGDTMMSVPEALRVLRSWKDTARRNAAADPMLLRNPAYERKPNPYKDFSYLECALQPGTRAVAEQAWQVVRTLTRASPAADRAVGSLYGLVVGDAFGAPFEFLAVDSRLAPPPRDGSESPPARSGKLFPSTWLRWLTGNPNRVSHAFFDALDPATGQITYVGEYNKFQLRRGQWTDDASMALCLADSLLAANGYDGGDCRVRFFNWWTCGYNNAFRYDETPGRTSVGLGGNIQQSFNQLASAVGLGKSARECPPEVSNTSNDSGNGSMMRLAPVPIRYAKNAALAMRTAALSSRATHPGADAAACTAFMAYFIARAITNPVPDPPRHGVTLAAFLDAAIAGFVKDVPQMGGTLPDSGGMCKVRSLLQCQPAGETNALWQWREAVLPTEQTLAARGEEFNGHPVSAEYFGAYSIDGLAMALWAMGGSRNSNEQRGSDKKAAAAAAGADECLTHVLSRVVNLRGDSDTTAAIACQMAGAFYGFNDLVQRGGAVGSHLIECVRKWDPMSEIPLRALMLADDGGLLDELSSGGPGAP